MYISFVLVAVVASLASGQVQVERWPVVPKDDMIRPTLDKWCKTLQAGHDRRELIQPRFSEWLEISSDDLRTLFPSYRFAVITWDELEHPRAREKVIGRAFGLQVTLAIDAASGKGAEFFGSGNYEQFGAFLFERGVMIQGEDDAKRVWNAFCEIHQHHWRDYGIDHPDKLTWHLGINEIGEYRYYYEVSLDSANKVVSAKLHAVKRKTANGQGIASDGAERSSDAMRG